MLSPIRTARAQAAGAALLLATIATGCDFTPALDIDTPEYEPGLVLRSVLVADSVATVRVGESWDPYEGRPPRYGQEETTEAAVTLLRDGQPVEQLALRSVRCDDYRRPPEPGGQPATYECGPYVGTVPVEAGGTYTVRAEAEGLPPAEATVTVPQKPAVTVTEEATATEDRQFRIRLTDPAGQVNRYGLSLLRSELFIRWRICDERGCRDSVSVEPNPRRIRYLATFDTSDPLLLASARQIDGYGIGFVTFPDETFDGRERTFVISSANDLGELEDGVTSTVQVAALAGDVYDLYQIATFSGGDDNPFAEPVNLPSNVEGGYGIVGAVALAEVDFAPREGS